MGVDRYHRVKGIVDEGYANAILIVSTNPSGALAARRMSYRVAKGKNFGQQFLYTNDDAQGVLTTGRLLAFAAAEFDDFPEDEDTRAEVRRVLSGNVAVDALRLSGLIDSMRNLG